MLPIRLRMKNFLAYRSPAALHFDGIHLACLSGANGAGKSSLLDAITWALWGKARAKRDEELIHQGQNEMLVELEFEQAGARYIVRRSRSRSRSAGSLEFFSVDADGTLERKDEGSMRATQALIERTIALDYETFVHSAFLRQGNADAFTLKPARERKQILSDILGLERFEGYEARAKARIEAISAGIAQDEGAIRQIDANLSREGDTRRALQAAQTALDEAVERTRIAEAAYDELRDAARDRRHAEDRLAELKHRLKLAEGRRSSAAQIVTTRRARVEEYQALIARREAIETGYHALQSARDRDQALSEKLIALRTLDDRRAEVERAIDAARAQLEGDARAIRARLEDMRRIAESGDAPALDALNGEIARLRTREDERDPTQKQIDAYTEERARLQSVNDALMKEMNRLKARQNALRAIESPLCPTCGKPLSPEERDALIAELQREGEPMGEEYRANRARADALKVLLKELQETLTQIRVDIQPLADMQAQAGVLAERLEQARQTAARMGQESDMLDALLARLEAEDYAHAERDERAAIDAERAALGYDDASHAEARQGLRQYNEYEMRYHQLNNALEAHTAAVAELDEAESALAALDAELSADRAAVNALEDQIAGLVALANEAQRRFDEMKARQTEEVTAREEAVALRQALRAIEDDRARRAELLARIDQARAERGLYEDLRVAFGKNGIPAMIIDAALPELEDSANQLLGRMTDGQMNIAITTQREKVTGGIAETLDIHIADGLGTRPYELYSGGESFRINFALRVALSRMLAWRAGAQLRTLFIDEGFGTQDEAGRAKLVEAITAIQDEFDLILVITHIDDLRDAFPVHVEIEKKSDGSEIRLR